MAIAVIPLGWCEGLHPRRCYDGEAIQRRAERLPHPLEPIEHANRGQHMRGVRPLASPRFEQPLRPCQRQQGVQEERRRLTGDEPCAKLAQDGMMEAGIGQFEPQDIFPINAAADGIRGLAIGETFSKLEDRDHREARWRFCGLPAPRKEGRELGIVVESAEPVRHLHIEVPPWECGTGHPLGIFRNRISGFRV